MVTQKRRLLVTLDPEDESRIAFLLAKLGLQDQSEVMRQGLRALAAANGFNEAAARGEEDARERR